MDATNKKREKTSLFRDLPLVFVLALLLTLASTLFIDQEPDPGLIKSLVQSPFILLMNYLPVLVLFFIFYFATKSLGKSFIILTLLIFIMGIANQNKLFYRDENLRLTDLRLIKEAFGMVREGNPIHFQAFYPVYLVLFLLLGLVLNKTLPSNLKTSHRLGGLVLSLALGTLALNTIFIDRDSYWNHSMGRYHPYIEVERAKDRGMIYSFVYAYRDFFYRPPDGYDPKEVEAILGKYQESMPPDKDRPDIILMLGESFADLEAKGAKLDPSVYQSFRKLQSQSIYGNMQDYSFGGGTIETERNVLTGLFLHGPYIENRNSFPWMLKSRGYAITAMHPFTGAFYNRLNTNKYLGLEHFLYSENYFDKYFINRDEDYFPDKILFPLILSHYDGRDQARPYFAFISTMQNHTPYSSDYKGYPDYLDRASFKGDGASYNSANNYLAGIKDSSDRLLALTEELEKRDSPVVLIFFGDHLARLGADGEIYQMMGVNIDQSGPQGWLNKYTTPYLIWTNSKAKELLQKDMKGEGPYMSNYYLFAYALHELGFKPPYSQYLMDRLGDCPIDATSYIWEDGQLTSAPGPRTLEKKKEFEGVQYYYNTHFFYKDFAKEKN